MDSMDLKGIAWVGNIYQKFEAMCLEVEEAMCQETAKYVENQVQTVGASMKRFCSDVMQDMLPPSSKDLSRVASADLLLNPYLEFGIHKKSISSIKEDAKDPVCIKGISEDKSNSSNDVWEDWSAASFNWEEISDKEEANCDRMAMQASNKVVECGSRGEKEGRIRNMIVDTSFTKSSAKGGKRSRCISSSNIIRAERSDTSEISGMVSQMGSQASSNEPSGQTIDGHLPHTDSCENSRQVSLSQTDSHISANAQCGQSVGEEVFWSHTANRDPDLEEENGATVQSMEPTGHESDLGFEETCVLVEGNDYRPVNHKEEIRRSYKKKIQSTFSLKKKSSARKQEYKQLAAQYGIMNAEPNIQGEEAIALAPTVSKHTKAKTAATHDSLELEWELL
ncbi:uncharacterized protein LOC112524626 isoform X2 [Cynara cardunculus var. scolymus]|uniref:uncharacterized protein LOC112524626 isoform X2 n=1 Tax=Cynara cardunculus var. scolymus TaxID=59895 RepID=UPI000D62380A|nr:uncharacterized protein LOC112524626 isoform X2 [Cynara cardunculus var. scolymus]